MQQRNGLQNARVVILGGSSGIGLAVAQEAASQGARIVIVSSNPERVQKAVEPFGDNAEGHALDLSDEQAVEILFTKLGAFDHLVFTASAKYPPFARPCRHQISNRLDRPRSCVIGRRWLPSNTEARISARVAQSCSPPELPGSARIKDGLLPLAFAEPSKP